ncbi:TonB-dependent receptor [Pseudomaricurvus alkylphenolicus]|uniref:TonB-dependent receptor n=1 Tax=Pseudomaricurvus alkylphenolicus TaxID=1306991 RepID=UPI0014221D9C|nr:TonB-dependent receptor [Pseudomaricurvus alkylphenolicus]NIB40921.1 TonB-dependent receptor [Pseudomaricurvus alkylphenolicus]
MYKKHKLSSAVLAAVTAMASAQYTAAQSGEVTESDKAFANTLEEVVVQGIRGSLQRSMDVKRDSSGVVDAISSEDIGKFPDQNLAESLQRITGVSIDRAGGEGQLITVRGFGPQFNTVLVNGRQMASENQTRAFSFDTISADMVSSINVHKTSTATQQSGGIGSTVNIATARPLQLDGMKLVGSVKALYDENSEETTPEFSGLFSNTFADDRVGVLVAVSHKESETRLNQAQADGWLENVGIPQEQLNGGAGHDGNIFSPRNYDTKVTFEERSRTNANLVLQFAPTDELELTFDALYSDFDIEADATSYGHWFTGPNIENAVTDENGTVIDLYQEVGLATDFHAKQFDRLTETKSFGFNADWHFSDNLNLKFDAFVSKAEREANNGGGNQLSLIGYANRVRFQSDDAILPWVSGFQDPADNIVDGEGISRPVSDYLDPANGRAHVMLRRGWEVEDDVQQFRMDGLWNEGNDTGLVEARFGLMFSNETKSLTRWDNEGVGIHCTFCGYPNSPDVPDEFQTLFDAGSDFLDGISGSGRTPTVWLQHNGEQQFSFLEDISGVSFDAVRRDNSFEVEEETLSAYMEMDFAGEIAGMRISATAGVRYESTDVRVDGTESPIEGLSILDQTEMVASFGAASPISATSDYTALLPNLSVNLEITENLVARFAASRTLTRPTLENMAPVTNIGTTRQGGNLTATAGNPELQPFESDNVDLSLEWYYDESSYVSVGYFQKDVNNFIINGTTDQTFVISDGSFLTDPSTGDDVNAPDANDQVAVFTTTLPNNGEAATVDGVELALQHTFGETGFGVIVNATLVDSDAELDAADINQKFAVTGLSDSMNLVGFYEKGPFQFRLAYNWRDKFLQSLTQTNGDGVTHVDEYEQWDMSGSYEINDNLMVVFEITNLTEEIVTKHGRFDNHFLLAEDAGRRFALGLNAKF